MFTMQDTFYTSLVENQHFKGIGRFWREFLVEGNVPQTNMALLVSENETSSSAMDRAELAPLSISVQLYSLNHKIQVEGDITYQPLLASKN